MPRAPQTPSSTKRVSTSDRAEPKVARARAAPESHRPAKAEVHSGIELGVRVRIVEGPFSGKVGVVQELDAKGGARVMLGLLAVRFELEHLTLQAERGVRPVLGTSHRKRTPTRS